MGAPCNACGICCLAEPCPLGVLLSRSTKGPCKALVWVAASRQYRCSALGDRPGSLRARLVARWIAAGVGCDCDLEPAPCVTIAASTSQAAPHD